MRSGALRQRARWQRLVRADDGMGGTDQSFTDIDWVWCKVSAVTSPEKYEAKKLTSAITHAVTVRYRPDYHFRQRLVVGTLVLDIDSVIDPTGRHQELQLLCVEIVQ